MLGAGTATTREGAAAAGEAGAAAAAADAAGGQGAKEERAAPVGEREEAGGRDADEVRLSVSESNSDGPGGGASWAWIWAMTRTMIVLGLSAASAVGQVNYAFGVVVVQLDVEQPEWSRTEVNAAFSINQVVGSLTAPLVGMAMQAYGARLTGAISLLVLSVGFGVLATVDSVLGFQLVFGAFGVGNSALVMLASGRVVSHWFPGKQRGRALGIVTTSKNFGGLLYPLVADALGRFRATMLGFCIIDAVIAVLFLAFLRDGPPQTPTCSTPTVGPAGKASCQSTTCAAGGADGWVEGDGRAAERVPKEDGTHPKPAMRLRDVLKTRVFWASTIGLIGAYWSFVGVLSQIPPALVSKGFSRSEATLVLSVVSVLGIPAKIVSGFLSERWQARRVFMGSMMVQAVATLILGLLPSGSSLLWPASLLYGAGIGGVGMLAPLLGIELFGDQFASVFGAQSMSFAVPSLVAPLVAGALFDRTGSYQYNFFLCSGVFVASTLALSAAAPAKENPAQGPGGPRNHGGSSSSSSSGGSGNSSRD